MAPAGPAPTRPQPGPGDTRWRTGLRIAIGVLLILQGVNHFISDDIMVRMMPSWLPAHRELVWASGVAEVVLGAGALLRRTRQLAGWGIPGRCSMQHDLASCSQRQTVQFWNSRVRPGRRDGCGRRLDERDPLHESKPLDRADLIKGDGAKGGRRT